MKNYPCPFPGSTHAYKRKSDCKKHIREHLQNNHNDISEVIQKTSSAFIPIPLKRISIKENCLCVLDN